MALCHVYAAKAAQTLHLKWHIANTKKCIYTDYLLLHRGSINAFTWELQLNDPSYHHVALYHPSTTTVVIMLRF